MKTFLSSSRKSSDRDCSTKSLVVRGGGRWAPASVPRSERRRILKDRGGWEKGRGKVGRFGAERRKMRNYPPAFPPLCQPATTAANVDSFALPPSHASDKVGGIQEEK